MMLRYLLFPAALLLAFNPVVAHAAEPLPTLDLTRHWVGYFALGTFALAYCLVVLEEVIELRKSKPMMLAAALIWVAIALVYKQAGFPEGCGLNLMFPSGSNGSDRETTDMDGSER